VVQISAISWSGELVVDADGMPDGAAGMHCRALLAISWSKKPFPGFMVEPTLIVNDTVRGLSGRSAVSASVSCRAHRGQHRHARRV